MIPNMIMVGNGKGGVYKTSITSNVAGLAAASGWKILAIDMDPQGHLAMDLGVEDRSDFGESLHDALITGSAPKIISDARPNLDLIAGGEVTQHAVGALQNQLAAGQLSQAVGALDRVIAPIAGNYHLILVDSPPGEKVLQQTILAAAHYVLVPTAVDLGSRRGLDRVCRNFVEARQFNPHLELLGVVMTAVERRATKMKATARQQLTADLEDLVPVFESVIHSVNKGGVDARERGQLAHEYEANADAERSRFKSVSDRIAARREGRLTDYSAGAGNLAGDYQALTDELLGAFLARQSPPPEAPNSGGVQTF